MVQHFDFSGVEVHLALEMGQELELALVLPKSTGSNGDQRASKSQPTTIHANEGALSTFGTLLRSFNHFGGAERDVHSSALAITVGPLLLPRSSVCTQLEESVQSSSQADNEEVSLRVNPTYAQEVQEDSEFSKLLSCYSPEDIISMLSKHTVRAMASSSSPSPFNASSSRPTPRPITPSRVPISPFPPPTPAPSPIPTPPSIYPPYVQHTPLAQSESIFWSEMEGLVRRLLAESLSLSKPHSLQNYCKLPNAYFPPGFKSPKYHKYDGTSDPQFHLAGFTMDSHRWLYDRVLLVHLFQQSL
ncbi:hypothetical protein Taro_002112 [Colocasia esculenta]|uniref:Uncharacterized protein n=1 Tax=Colocasia esculenta TaxID=4460 RepID=A0A843TGD4_COLES|nr:hypothetical protein [Colocasia esculenta]